MPASLVISSVAVLLLAVVVWQLALYAARSFTEPFLPPVPNRKRVACIGDSNTEGIMLLERRRESYPAQLQSCLGQEYCVRNFGASGYTLQKAADLPYWQHKYFSWSTSFNPDVVFIMLGSNDTKVHNWRGLDRFLQDLREMLDHYRSLASRPVVFLMTPPKQFVVRDNTAVSFEMSDEVAAQMSGAIRRLGQQEDVPVIDIRSATAAHPDFFASDGVHANADGLKLIAELTCQAVLEHNGPLRSREA